MELQSLFLRQFDSDLIQTQVRQFGRHLNRISPDYDVLLFLARKAACFYHCLEVVKLTHGSTTVCTDRVLGMDLEWLANKRIAIIDDVVVTGTSINDITVYLDKHVPSAKWDVHVLAVDEDNWREELVSPVNEPLRLRESACARLSGDIVQAMTLIPRPYSVDYPLYARSKIYGKDVQAVSCVPGWTTFDVSSLKQKNNGVVVLTCLPEERTATRFANRVGLRGLNIGNILKIRVYARLNLNTFIFRVLPIVTLPALTRKKLNVLFEELVGSAFDNSESGFIRDNFTSGKSRLRLIQFLLAARLGRLWIASLKRVVTRDIDIDFTVDHREMELLFSPHVIASITKSLDSEFYVDNFDASENADAEFYTCDEEDVIKAIDVNGCSDVESCHYRLSAPFIKMYENKELTLRRKAREGDIDGVLEESFKETKDRLRNGVSIHLLRSLLPEYSDDDKVSIVSAFLDIAIDAGVVVPITVKQKKESREADVISRAYRHGEEIRLTNKEKWLINLMLDAFYKKAGYESVPITFFEKLIVLFIKAGVTTGILTEFSKGLTYIPKLSVRYYAFGALTQMDGDDDVVFHFDPDLALTKHLKELGIIEIKERGGDRKDIFYLGVNDQLGLDYHGADNTKRQYERDSQSFGQLMSKLFSKTPRKRETDDVTLLATCLYPNNTALALAADLNIFLKSRSAEIEAALLNGNPKLQLQLIEKIHDGFIYSSIRSGVWKYLSYRKKDVHKVFKKYLDMLSDDFTDLSVWESYWPDYDVLQSVPYPEFIEQQINGMGALLIKAFSLMAMLCYSFYKELDQAAITIELEREMRTYTRLLAKYGGKDEYTELHGTVLGRLPLKNKLELLSGELSRIADMAEPLLTEVREKTQPYSEKDQIHYYATTIYFEVFSDDEDVVRWCEQSIKSIAHAMESRIRKQGRASPNVRKTNRKANPLLNDNPMWLVDVPFKVDDKYLKLIVAANKDISADWVVELIDKVSDAISKFSGIRITVFTGLPSALQDFSVGLNSTPIRRDLLNMRFQLLEELSVTNRTEVLICDAGNAGSKGDELLRLLGKVKGDIERNFDTEMRLGSVEPIDAKLFSIDLTNRRISRKKQSVDFVILVFVPEEYLGVKKEIREIGKSFDLKAARGANGYFGNLNGKKVYVQYVEDTGQFPALRAVTDIFTEFSPKYLSVIGTARGLQPDKHSLGDVVIAEHVNYYEKGKDDKGFVLRENRPHEISTLVREGIGSYFVSRGGRDEAGDTAYSVDMGTIGSGEKNIEDNDSPLVNWLLSVDRKTYLADMESASVFYGSRNRDGLLGTIVVKGISDFCPDDKNSKSFLNAATNAAQVFKELSKHLEV